MFTLSGPHCCTGIMQEERQHGPAGNERWGCAAKVVAMSCTMSGGDELAPVVLPLRIRTETEKANRSAHRRRRRMAAREQARQVAATRTQLLQSQEWFWTDADGRKYCCAQHAESLRAELAGDPEDVAACTGCTFIGDRLRQLDECL